MLQRLALATLIILSVGCASVPMATPQEDAAAKAFTSKPGVASVYIYRNESIGAAVTMDVALDGKPLGNTVANTFLYTEVAPGKHTLTSEAENTDELVFEAVAGQLYFIWQEVKMGWLYARNELHLVKAGQGKSGVRETKLAITRQPTATAATTPEAGQEPST